jgi:RNA polymerase sigma-70 factor (sigma-E family)
MEAALGDALPAEEAERYIHNSVTLEGLFVAEYVPMLQLAFLMVGDNGTAEDAVQEAFARVQPKLASIDRPGAYLRAVVVNECRNVHRRRRLARRQQAVAPPAIIVDHPVELSDALRRLPPRQRHVVVLRFYADLPEAEIAELLACRVGTVKSALHRALTNLREVIPQ